MGGILRMPGPGRQSTAFAMRISLREPSYLNIPQVVFLYGLVIYDDS